MCTKPNITRHGEFLGGLAWVQKTKGEAWTKKALAEGEIQLIPCNQCLQCRIQYAAAWAARCELESQYHKDNYFVTVTYDDQHLPIHNMIEDSQYKGVVNPLAMLEGRTVERPTLCKKDHQDFIKRLRITAQRKGLLEENFKYYMCGEYGDRYGRPHYHYILFGLKIPDLTWYKSGKGYDHYKSEWLQKIWGQGLVDIGSVTYLSCQYVARYVVKKRKGQEAQFYKKAGIAPEFVQMSLKPAIGGRYWEEHRDEIYRGDQIYLKSGRTIKPPRYFDMQEDAAQLEFEQDIQRAAEIFDGEEALPQMESGFMKEIKRQRKVKAMNKLWGELKKTNLDMASYYQVKEDNFRTKHEKAKDRNLKDI